MKIEVVGFSEKNTKVVQDEIYKETGIKPEGFDLEEFARDTEREAKRRLEIVAKLRESVPKVIEELSESRKELKKLEMQYNIAANKYKDLYETLLCKFAGIERHELAQFVTNSKKSSKR